MRVTAHANPRCRSGLVYAEVAQACASVSDVPAVLGVSIGQWDDRATWRIAFTEQATDEQRSAAMAALAAYSTA